MSEGHASVGRGLQQESREAAARAQTPGLRLWRLAREGDVLAREEVTQRAGAIASYWYRRWDVPPSEVDDYCQELCLAVARRIDESGLANPTTSFSTWVRWLAFSTMQRQRRLRQTRLSVMSDDGLDKAEGQEAEGWKSAHDRDLVDAYRACLSKLRARDRDMVAARLEKGTPPSELAKQYGLKPDAIRMRVFRCILRLRECMESKGFSIP